MAFEMEWAVPCVLKRFSGVVSPREFLHSVQRVAANPRFDELRFVVNDFTKASRLVLDPSTLDDVTAIRIGSRLSNSRINVLVVDPLDICEELKSAMRSPPLHHTDQTVFLRSLDDAHQWMRQRAFDQR